LILIEHLPVHCGLEPQGLGFQRRVQATPTWHSIARAEAEDSTTIVVLNYTLQWAAAVEILDGSAGQFFARKPRYSVIEARPMTGLAYQRQWT